MPRDVGKGLDPKRDEQETSCTVGDELCRGRQDMPREAGAGDRSGGVRQVAKQKTHLEAEDTLEGGRWIGRWKMHWKAEDALEGGGGVGSRSRVRDGKAWRKGVPLTDTPEAKTSILLLYHYYTAL